MVEVDDGPRTQAGQGQLVEILNGSNTDDEGGHVDGAGQRR